jgi:hypothetical protein
VIVYNSAGSRYTREEENSPIFSIQRTMRMNREEKDATYTQNTRKKLTK